MDEFLKLGTEYRYHLIDDLPGKVVGAFIQDPRRLCFRLEQKIMRTRDYIDVTKYEDINRGIAQPNYASLAGMLVATVKWAEISIKRDQTALALECLSRATKDRKKVDNVVERYNRRFNAAHKEI